MTTGSRSYCLRGHFALLYKPACPIPDRGEVSSSQVATLRELPDKVDRRKTHLLDLPVGVLHLLLIPRALEVGEHLGVDPARYAEVLELRVLPEGQQPVGDQPRRCELLEAEVEGVAERPLRQSHAVEEGERLVRDQLGEIRRPDRVEVIHVLQFEPPQHQIDQLVPVHVGNDPLTS